MEQRCAVKEHERLNKSLSCSLDAAKSLAQKNILKDKMAGRVGTERHWASSFNPRWQTSEADETLITSELFYTREPHSQPAKLSTGFVGDPTIRLSLQLRTFDARTSA